MDRQTTFLLALAMLIAAAATVSLSGWVLYVRDRRAHRSSTAAPAAETAGTTSSASPSIPASAEPHHEAAGEH